MLLALSIIAGSVALDRAVKFWAVHSLKNIGTLPVIKNVFNLTYAENTGAAFSFMEGGRWFFIGVTVIILAFIIVLIRRGYIKHPLGNIALYMVIGGAVGNLIDRARQGYVVDMFDLRIIRFAIFNVADSFITVGGVLFAAYILFLHDRKEKKKEETEDGA
ncbi:MAG: signal peptidase II [Bacillota bacterium]|nr:signal peptidase II [Bacillota bacterium]